MYRYTVSWISHLILYSSLPSSQYNEESLEKYISLCSVHILASQQNCFPDFTEEMTALSAKTCGYTHR